MAKRGVFGFTGRESSRKERQGARARRKARSLAWVEGGKISKFIPRIEVLIPLAKKGGPGRLARRTGGEGETGGGLKGGKRFIQSQTRTYRENLKKRPLAGHKSGGCREDF